MKKLLAALVLTSAAAAAPAFADVGVSIRVGEPGFYGQLDLGGYGAPRLINSRPVVVVHRYRNPSPLYLRVPPGHQRNWNKYCGRYDACYRPVYFVRDEWYRDVYAPRYRRVHEHDWRDDRRGNGRDERRDDRRDDRWGDRNDDHRDDRGDGRRDDHRDDHNGKGPDGRRDDRDRNGR